MPCLSVPFPARGSWTNICPRGDHLFFSPLLVYLFLNVVRTIHTVLARITRTAAERSHRQLSNAALDRARYVCSYRPRPYCSAERLHLLSNQLFTLPPDATRTYARTVRAMCARWPSFLVWPHAAVTRSHSHSRPRPRLSLNTDFQHPKYI